MATFYSYKGGVGRTTLAANTAVELARHGKTLLWDLDIEAPGLHLIRDLAPATPATEGSFDRLIEWQQSQFAPPGAAALAAWDRCILPVARLPALQLLPAFGDPQRLVAAATTLDWARIFGREPALGLDLIDRLLAHWATRGIEFVVIDARTGITDLGALLAAVVPDITLLVGNFAQQNTAGLRIVWDALQPATGELAARVERGREPLLRRLVVSPRPVVDAHQLAAGRQVWQEHFGLAPSEWLEIDEHPDLRFSEQVLLLSQPEAPIAAQYRAVAAQVLRGHQARLAARRAEAEQAALYPEHTRPRALPDAAARGKDAQQRGERFEDRVAHVLQLLRYQVERETLVDANRIDLIATTHGTLEDTTWFVECKDSVATKGMVDKLALWITHPQAKARQARGMLVAREFAPAALQSAKNSGVLCTTLAQLEERLFNFKPYLARLRANFEQSPLASCYVAQRLAPEGQPTPRADGEPPEPIDLLPHAVAWAGGRGRALWVLLGDYGTGKTAFTQRLAYELARRCEEDSTAPVPLLINLRDYPNATSLEGVIDEHLAKTVDERGRSAAVLHLLAQGRCVLLLDSFDEMGLAAVGVSMEEQFRQLARPTGQPGRARVLITCREEFFRERTEAVDTAQGRGDRLARAGSALEQAARAFDAQIDTLPYFDRSQVLDYLGQRLGAQAGAEALAHIESVHGLADLATRPQLLEIVLESLPELVQRGQAVNAGVLYHTYVSRWLQRHRPVGARLAIDELLQVLELLAQSLWARGAAPIHYSQLARLVEGYQAIFPTRDPLRVDLELRTAAFLTRSAEGHYRFSHRSFLEFFYARRLFRLGQADDGKGLAEAVSGTPLRPEVVRFFGDLWAGNGSAGPCPLTAQLLAEPQAPMVAGNLFRLAWWQGSEAMRGQAQTRETRARRDAVRQAALPQAPARLQLIGADLSGMDLAGATLASAVLDDAVLRGCRLSGACLDGASLQRADLSDARLEYAQCSGLKAQGLVGINSVWAGATLSQVDLSGAQLRQSDWRGSAWQGVVLLDADLAMARLDTLHQPLALAAHTHHASFWGGLNTPPTPCPALRPTWRQLPMGPVNSVAYAPDGRCIAVGDQNGSLRLLDAATGQELRHFEGLGGSVHSVAFSPDGRHIASGGDDGSLRLWDAASGQELRRFEGHDSWVLSVVFSPDGRYIASGSVDRSLCLWDAATGLELRRVKGHVGSVNSVAFSPDGRHIISGSGDRGLCLWDAASSEELRRFEGHGGSVNSVAFSPDGRHIASGDDEGSLRLWDAASGQELRRFDRHGGSVRSVAISPDGRHIASGGDEESLCLWDAISGHELRRFEGHDHWVRCVAFSPDGRHIASGGNDSSLRLWDTASGQELRRFRERGGAVNSVAFSPDGRHIASGGVDRSLRLWNAASGEELRRFEGHRSWVFSVAFSPDGRHIASGGVDRSLRLWDAASGEELKRFEGHGDWVRSVAFSPDGRHIASGDDEGCLHLWDATSGQELLRVERHGGSINSVAFSPDGRQVASGGDGGLRLWDATSGHELRHFEGHGGSIYSVAFSPDGHYIASGGHVGSLWLWDAASGQKPRRFGGHGDWVRSVAFSPDGRLIASGDDKGSVLLWDAASGQKLRRIYGRGGPVPSVAFSRDGHLSFGGAVLTVISPDAGGLANEPRFEARALPSGAYITLYPDGTHTASDADPDSLEWLVYEELPATPPDPTAPPDLFPTLHRATDVPWLRRPAADITPTR